MNTQSVTIRVVDRDEVAVLRELSERTFHDTYVSYNTEENMAHYCNLHFSVDSLNHQLNIPDSFFFFAECDGAIVGYLKLNKGEAQTEMNLKNALEIERVYVQTDAQGKGIGAKFLQKSIEIATSFGLEKVWLGVWERNTKAIEFYEKNGFKAFAKHPFKLGDDLQQDVMMKIELCVDS